ncbi:MAG: hypothetical protein R2854_27765 [Caldilineaceae bacterium]
MTAFDPQRLLRPDVADMEEYTPIQPFEVLSRRLGLAPGAIVKLDANENPYGPAPGVAEALAEYPYYHIYPDPQQTELRAALSAYANVPAANILPSYRRGRDAGLFCRLFCSRARPSTARPLRHVQLRRKPGRRPGDRPCRGCPTTPWTWMRWRSLCTTVAGGVPKLLFLTAFEQPGRANWLPPDGMRQPGCRCWWCWMRRTWSSPTTKAGPAGCWRMRTWWSCARSARPRHRGLRLGYGAFARTGSWAQLWKFKQPYNVNVAATVAILAKLRRCGAPAPYGEPVVSRASLASGRGWPQSRP